MENKTWININLDNIVDNFKAVKTKYSKYKYYMADVSYNAYGHGMIEVSKQLIKNGADYLIVDNFEAALVLRKKYKFIPILCSGEISLDKVESAIKNSITISVFSDKFLIELIKMDIKKVLKIHICLNLGFNKKGIDYKLKEKMDIIFDHPKIYIEGLSVRLHDSISENTESFDSQINNLMNLTEGLDLEEFEMIHIYDSNNLFCHPKLKMANTIRITTALYGINLVEHKNPIKLLPTLEFFAKIGELIFLSKDETLESINYKAKFDMIIAEIPIGTKDGLSKENIGRNVSIENKRYKLIGDIKENSCYVFVDESVKENTPVAFIGQLITLTEISEYLKLSSEKIVSNLNQDITREYQKGKKKFLA